MDTLGIDPIATHIFVFPRRQLGHSRVGQLRAAHLRPTANYPSSTGYSLSHHHSMPCALPCRSHKCPSTGTGTVSAVQALPRSALAVKELARALDLINVPRSRLRPRILLDVDVERLLRGHRVAALCDDHYQIAKFNYCSMTVQLARLPVQLARGLSITCHVSISKNTLQLGSLLPMRTFPER